MAVSILYKREFKINDKIKVVIPTVGQVLDNEDEYYGMVTTITAMPIDMMVQLDELGIDYTEINSFELFMMMFRGLFASDTSLVFGDMDVSKFTIGQNNENGQMVLIDSENDIVIDRLVYEKIATVLRRIHGFEKNVRKPGNEEAKRYLLEREKKKRMRKPVNRESQIEPLIISMVNTEQYKYNYDETLDLTIYQFNQSVRQIVKKVDYDNRMFGIYSGTISSKDIKQDDLTWITHNSN